MANILRHGFGVPRSRWYHGSVVAAAVGRRSCTSDALVEIKPDEVGIVSSIPQEQLRRRMCDIHAVCSIEGYVIVIDDNRDNYNSNEDPFDLKPYKSIKS
ncbi:hypothetical protein L2E82_06942 [Cichorium intybus]|uniref:Uncharacterized protein n=1 Tax=Cichorium intybus TaxID=13427 RepID=A0ACB9G430_CICIN|nr:hypothetical protein L2E82_06942 [Cichorium intybus]